jgi:hypothetical protein
MQDLADTIQTQLGAVNAQQTVLGDRLQARNEKAKALHSRMVHLISELRMRLTPTDQRWKSFGLNTPGTIERPEAVVNLVATLIGPATVAMKWDAALRANFYHVYKKVVGVDSEFVRVGSPVDVDFNLEGLPNGSIVEIVVTAVNEAGDGAESNKVTVTTHP